MRQKLLLIASLFTLVFTTVKAQVEIVVPLATDTVVCNGAPLTMQAVTNGYHSHTVSLSVDDQYSVLEPIGFTFDWYGTNYTNFVISSNGYITFNSSSASGSSAWAISTGVPGNPNCRNSVLGVYMDLYIPAGGTVTYGVAGVAPYRKLVVNFCDVHYFDCTTKKASFQIILYETTNIAEVHIKSKQTCTTWNSGAGIEGVEKNVASVGTVAPGRNYPGTWTVTSPDGRRFTPNSTYTAYTCDTIPYNPIPDSAATIYWYSGSTYLGAGPTITVNPTVPTTYEALAVTCGDTSMDFANVTIGNGPVITGFSPLQPSVCGACDGGIIIHGLDPGSSDTINYTKDGIPQSQIVLVPDGAGDVTITGLCAGVYDNFTDKVGYCISNVYGPVTVTDPYFGISGVSHTNTSCSACDGTMTIAGLTPNQTITINYDKDGVPQPPYTAVSAPDGTITISNLCSNGGGNPPAVYDNITATLNTCLATTTASALISAPPLIPITLVGSTQPTQCGACNGSISIKGTPPGVVDTIYFSKDGYAQPAVLYAAGPDSVVTIYNLCAGVYNDFFIKVGPCPTSTLTTPVTLVDSPIHAEFNTITKYGCTGDTVYFVNTSYASGTSTLYYVWNLGDGASDTFANPMHIYSVQGTYVVTLTASNHNAGCNNTVSQSINLVHPISAAFTATNSAGNDTVCQQMPLVFTNTSTGTPPTFTWNFGDGTVDTARLPNHSYEHVGTYTIQLVATNFVPCSDTAYQTVVVDTQSNATITTLTDTTICQGTYITFGSTFANEGLTHFTWDFGNGDSIINVNPVTYAYNTAGTFTATETSYYRICLAAQASHVVNVIPQPTIFLGNDTSICEGSDPIILWDNINAGNPAANWMWNTGSTTSAISVTSPGNYYATVSIGNCSASDSVNVANDCYMALPNIFTPNGDGVNDFFYPRQLLTKGVIEFKMDIYNRWGQLIFTTTAIDGSGWDGKFNDVPQPEGVYVFIIDAKFKDGKKEHHQGNLTLLK